MQVTEKELQALNLIVHSFALYVKLKEIYYYSRIGIGFKKKQQLRIVKIMNQCLIRIKKFVTIIFTIYVTCLKIFLIKHIMRNLKISFYE